MNLIVLPKERRYLLEMLQETTYYHLGDYRRLSLLYLLLYLDLYVLGDDALIANQTSMCLDPHLN